MLSESTVQRLRALTNFPAIIGFLSRDLDWPIEAENIIEENLDDYTFEYTPDELGIDDRYSAKITRIRQLRNLVNNQPWGIFYLEFESRRLPVTALRRVLNRLVRATEDRPGWETEDLLFICVQGAPGERGVAFAHFRKGSNERLPELRTFSWDSRESHFYYIRNLSLEKLRWPGDETNLEAWREQWRSAFTTRHREVINTAESLASAMAAQAREIRELIEDLYEIENRQGYLHQLLDQFQKELFGDLTLKVFADLVAQTMTYGLFSAAAQSTNVDLDHLVDFIPKTNPFLRGFLRQLIQDRGVDLYDLGIDQLINLYREANVPMIAHNFMRRSGGGAEDPIIHFYEQFLNEYDRQQRIERGVFYTPNPVVSYIVRSVDHLLKHEFGVEDGLASNTRAINPKTGQEEHAVQVLDPATGTGTFLQYIIEEIANLKNPGGADKTDPDWNRYVAEDLLPRLNGIELMIAAHTIAHTKLALKLEQTGYQFGGEERLRVYLANTLDNPRDKQHSLEIGDYLQDEFEGARATKTDRPIMVVIGNPPYSGISVNNGAWIVGLIQDYYEVDGKPLGEKKVWLQDDYVKFIRFGQERIAETGEGILAFVTNHGYLSNPTFRGMRQQLMKAFNEIYILDLHGNANKRETTPDGSEDNNVFDIRQGVSIGLFVKHRDNSNPSRIYHTDLWGTREEKYNFLAQNTFLQTSWEEIEPTSPYYLFIPTTDLHDAEYFSATKATDIFTENNAGIVTARDHFVIDFDANILLEKISALRSTELSDAKIRQIYFQGAGSSKYPAGDTRGWKLPEARKRLQSDTEWRERITKCLYRPFDYRPIYYTPWMVDWPRPEIMQHMIAGDNLAFVGARSLEVQRPYDQIFCTREMIQHHTLSIKEVNYLFPLYYYRQRPSENNGESKKPARPQQLSLEHIEDVFEYTPYDDLWERRPNLNPDFVADMEKRLGLRFITEGRGDLVNTFGPEDVFHYAYAVFHSPTYRTRYAEFLKIDFPRLPLTNDLVLFNKLVQKGADLVALHLLEDDYAAASWTLDGDESPLANHGVTFHEGQDARVVGKFSGRNYDDGRVYLDSSKKDGISYFEGVEPEVWEFQIGGYQVLHKWLYDRRAKSNEVGRTLTDEDIQHYQRVVASLRATIDLMRDIDLIIDDHGGWPLRGSQPDEAEEDETMVDNGFPKSEEDLFGRRSPQIALGDMSNSSETDDRDIPPDELTSDMIEQDLQRLSGVEAEVDDSAYRLSTETDEDIEEDIQPFDPKKINIVPRTLTVQQLMTKIQDYEESDGEIGMNLRPDFQRMGGIWNDEKQSRLLESMMIRIPLPAFYMNESEGNEDLWLVIDGLQRLTAMRRFMLDKSLRLRKLEFWKEYEGNTFDDLPLTLRRRIEETQVNIYLVKDGTPHNVKFNIFKRINTGGAPLSGQEIRHALNQGAATDLLADFANLPEFKHATDNGVSPIRMTDRECVLRFLAFMEKDQTLRDEFGMRDVGDYSRRDELDSFLNEQLKAFNSYLGSRRNPNQERWDQLEHRFKRVMLASREVFENRAFRKPTDSGRRSAVSKALFEVWAVNLDRCTDDELAKLITRREQLEEAFKELMDDTDFVISVSYSTGNEKRVQYRFDRINNIIQETLNNV